MGAREDLQKLIDTSKMDCERWFRGRVPEHYKRNSLDNHYEIAIKGAEKLFHYYGDKFIPYYTQSLIAGLCFSNDYDNVHIVTPSQYGKLISDDTPILSRRGWITHGELVKGDYVVGENGEWVKVLHIHPKSYANKRLTFINGESIDCHENHEWLFYGRNGTRCKKYETKALGEIFINGKAKYLLPQTAIVKGDYKPLKVNPYVLGVWLGDGNSVSSKVCVKKDELITLKELRKYYPDGSMYKDKHTGVYTYIYKGLITDLHSIGLGYGKDQKHIPEEYLLASRHQRLELLAGLIDTDGYIANGRNFYSTTCVALKDSVERLVHSFGWRTSTQAVPPKVSTSGFIGRKTTYIIGFQNTEEIPCRVKRKINTNITKQRKISLKSIEDIEPKQGNCITVEGGVYRVGENLMLTHNSYLLGHINLVQAYEGGKQYIACANAEQTKIIMQEVQKSIKDIDEVVINKILGIDNTKLDRLEGSLSKTRISIAGSGFIEAITLGDTYSDRKIANQAIGRGGNMCLDEASLISDSAMAELGRGELNSIDGKKSKFIAISNPHNQGWFYNAITKPQLNKRDAVVWMDARTALEEHRWTKEQVENSKFNLDMSTLKRYWLCELDTIGDGMFPEPVVKDFKENEYTETFVGLDMAHKGDDNIVISKLLVNNEKELHLKETYIVPKPKDWIDGVTEKELSEKIVYIIRNINPAMLCVDVGQGTWISEPLSKSGIPFRMVHFASKPNAKRRRARQSSATTAHNVRAEMHLDLKDCMDSGILTFSESVAKELQLILPHIRAKYRANGSVQVEDKAELKKRIGKSPDEFDSILLALHGAMIYYQE